MSTAAPLAPARRRPPWLVPVAAVAAVLVTLELVGTVTGPGPSGPTSSSYATASDGLAAWAELAQRAGHPVVQLRQSIGEARLNPAWTLVVLDPNALLHGDGLRLRAFARAGGRVLIGGNDPDSFLTALYPNPPTWDASSGILATPTPAGARALPGVARVRTAGNGAWAQGEAGQPLLAYADGDSVILARPLGRGEILLVADASPLQNRLLGSADNAQFALDLAGARARPVVFVESVHGFGQSRGLAALPTSWRLAFALLALAGALWALARGRRLGPAEPEHLASQPPRAAYIEALALLLTRTSDPEQLATLLTRLRERG